MKKRFRLFDLCIAVILIIAVSLLLNNHLNARQAALEAERQSLRLEQIALESVKSSLQSELNRKDTDSYIIQVAREEYFYLMPGEILFKVSNIDDLYAVHEVSVEDAQ